MDTGKILEKLKLRLGVDDSDELLNDLMEDSKSLYFSLRYPTSKPPVDDDEKPIVDPKYESWILRCALEMYQRLGFEGQQIHAENGINRHYDGGTVSESLKREVTPIVGLAR